MTTNFTPRRNWAAVDAKRVAHEASAAHIQFLLQDALDDLSAMSDMYEALEAFQQHVIRHSCAWDEAENGSHHHPVWEQVAAALAKARGEA